MITNINIFYLRLKFEHLIGGSIDTYLKEHKMCDVAAWGTDTEIIALATAFDSIIVIYCCLRGSCKYVWYYYNPIHKKFGESNKKENEKIYLNNPGNHYDRVLAVK